MNPSDPQPPLAPAKGAQRRPKLGRPPTLDRAAALKAAHDVIAERGFDRTRYADVAAESGIPVTTLQHAFGSLQALLLESVRSSTASEIAVLRALSNDPSLTPWGRLSAFISAAIQHTNDTKFWRVWTELYGLSGRDPELGAFAGELYLQWWEYLEELIVLGVERGDFTSPITKNVRHAALAIDGLVDGLAVTLIVRADGPDFVLARAVALEAVASMLGYTGPVGPVPAGDER